MTPLTINSYPPAWLIVVNSGRKVLLMQSVELNRAGSRKLKWGWGGGAISYTSSQKGGGGVGSDQGGVYIEFLSKGWMRTPCTPPPPPLDPALQLCNSDNQTTVLVHAFFTSMAK